MPGTFPPPSPFATPIPKVSNAQLNKAKKTPKPDPGDECPDNIDEAFPIDPPENLLNADTIHELHWWLMEHMKILEDSKGHTNGELMTNFGEEAITEHQLKLINLVNKNKLGH